MEKPSVKPQNPNFSSGPCSKRPGWSLSALEGAMLGRSHRAGPAKAKLKAVIEEHRRILGIPDDYSIGIVPASDTGAVEMAMWSMLGERGVDVLAWESFSGDWLKDIKNQLKLDDVREFKADYGHIPNLEEVDTDRDVVFCWNGTTSGVRVPDANWIAEDRQGLTICDATSAVFAYALPWELLDVTTWSWQKVLGGEAAHGMIVLSPRAVQRLETYTPEGRPLPKIFRMTKNGLLNKGIFEGATINTPSMLAVEDCLDALQWVESVGGLSGTIKRCDANFAALNEWVERTAWVEFLGSHESIRSTTSVCLKIVDEAVAGLADADQTAFVKAMTKLLDAESVAYDIAGYRDAPPGLRIWCGATVEASDVGALIPWLEWAFEATKAEQVAQAA